MADSTFTNKLEDFLDKNTPGGYIITNVNISNDDLTERINSVLSTKGYLDHTSTLPYNQITDKPIFSDVAISGNYEDLTNKPDN